MRFEGKNALVTGGARGIGAATAERLASEGARVVVADFDEAAAQETAGRLGNDSLAVRCDVTKRDDVEAAVAAANGVDILVTCAGVIRDNLLFKMDDDDWNTVIDTHLKGTFYAVRAAQKDMVERKSGKIVTISSTSALGNRGQTNYSAAKAGMQGMTKTWAVELGPFGVNVNCVAPGFVATAMTKQTAERVGVDFEAFAQHAAEQTALKHVGQPEDIAAVIAFLASDDARYVTGQVIYVAGSPRPN